VCDVAGASWKCTVAKTETAGARSLRMRARHQRAIWAGLRSGDGRLHSAHTPVVGGSWRATSAFDAGKRAGATGTLLCRASLPRLDGRLRGFWRQYARTQTRRLRQGESPRERTLGCPCSSRKAMLRTVKCAQRLSEGLRKYSLEFRMICETNESWLLGLGRDVRAPCVVPRRVRTWAQDWLIADAVEPLDSSIASSPAQHQPPARRRPSARWRPPKLSRTSRP
jgi:hypothetical protein